MGHEAYGKVLQIGKKVKNIKIGDHVIISWIPNNSKQIPFQNEYYTDGKTKINSGAVSTFQQFSLIPENRVYKTKLKKSVLLPLLGCSIPTGYGMYKSLKKKSDDHCGILGCGGIGLVILNVLLKYTQSKIYILERKKINLKHNRKFFKKVNFYNSFSEFKKNFNKIKLFFETTGNIDILNNLIREMNNNSSLIFASNHNTNKKLKIDPFEFIKGKQIYGTWGGNLNMKKEFNNLEKFFNFYKKNFPKKLYKVYSFDQINKAIDDYKKGKVLKSIIRF